MQIQKRQLTIAVALEKLSAYGLEVMAHLARETFPAEVKFSKWTCGHPPRVLLPVYHKITMKHITGKIYRKCMV